MSQEWLIIVPDQPNSLDKRMEVRPQHLSNLKPIVESGKVVFGGATLDRHPKEGEGAGPINGSAMIIVADSKEEALETMKGDIYAEKGVWNLEKMQVFPFRSAVRKGL